MGADAEKQDCCSRRNRGPWSGQGAEGGCGVQGRSLVLSNRPGEKLRGEQRGTEIRVAAWSRAGKLCTRRRTPSKRRQTRAGCGGGPRTAQAGMRRASGRTSGGRLGGEATRGRRGPALCEPPRSEGLGGGTGTLRRWGRSWKAEEVAGTAVVRARRYCLCPWEQWSRRGGGRETPDGSAGRGGAASGAKGALWPLAEPLSRLSQSHCH